ncbi:UNKNOWN [Stylonychia lemnae]|uniref:Uncharacterized protein n=1 Tax=Stylonychia lemnae TaxID=5949 RepID=A0A078A1V4_STYLE|nr:UNKNOWN [Stylonychia lemnae]|eukprot:CDW75807.1 UNKNOWN [Stylonychia lemnae]
MWWKIIIHSQTLKLQDNCIKNSHDESQILKMRGQIQLNQSQLQFQNQIQIPKNSNSKNDSHTFGQLENNEQMGQQSVNHLQANQQQTFQQNSIQQHSNSSKNLEQNNLQQSELQQQQSYQADKQVSNPFSDIQFNQNNQKINNNQSLNQLAQPNTDKLAFQNLTYLPQPPLNKQIVPNLSFPMPIGHQTIDINSNLMNQQLLNNTIKQILSFEEIKEFKQKLMHQVSQKIDRMLIEKLINHSNQQQQQLPKLVLPQVNKVNIPNQNGYANQQTLNYTNGLLSQTNNTVSQFQQMPQYNKGMIASIMGMSLKESQNMLNKLQLDCNQTIKQYNNNIKYGNIKIFNIEKVDRDQWDQDQTISSEEHQVQAEQY